MANEIDGDLFANVWIHELLWFECSTSFRGMSFMLLATEPAYRSQISDPVEHLRRLVEYSEHTCKVEHDEHLIGHREHLVEHLDRIVEQHEHVCKKRSGRKF